MMRFDSWWETAGAEALEQYNLPIEEFQSTIKCCFNCNRWTGIQQFNYSASVCRLCNKITHWDSHCWRYWGSATVDNLLDFGEVKILQK